jgi:NAD+ synthase
MSAPRTIAGHPIPDEIAIDEIAVQAICRAFLRGHFETTGAQQAIIGLSGGVDSALVAALLVDALGPKRVTGVLMPAGTSSPSSLADGQLVAESLGIRTEIVPITAALDTFVAGLPDAAALTPIRRGNAAARLRMTTLYDRSAAYRGLVVGTGNKSESLIGYSTIFGDAASALNPIGDLYKSQVRQLSAQLGVPEQIIAKAPSADLWPGQTDEAEGGFDYPTLDRVLYRLVDLRLPQADVVAAGFDASFVARVEGLIVRSEFKRQMPPIAKIGSRSSGADYLYPRRRRVDA